MKLMSGTKDMTKRRRESVSANGASSKQPGAMPEQRPGNAPGNSWQKEQGLKARPISPQRRRSLPHHRREWMNRADGAHDLCVSMPGPLAQAGMNRAFGP